MARYTGPVCKLCRREGEKLFHIADGAYAVTAVKAKYSFTPSEVPVTVDGKDAVVQTFVGAVSGGNAGSGGTHNFFPMKPGATWTFESKYDDSDYYSHTYIEKIVGSATHGGKTYWMHETSSPDEYFSYADTTLYRIDNNVLYGFFNMDMFFKSAPKKARDRIAKTAAAAKSVVTMYGNEMAILKFGQSPGTTWTIFDTGVFQGYSMKATGKFLGTENVNVPAGNFTGCAKFEVVFVTTSMDSETNTTYTYTERSVMWFAPGVGNVKNVEVLSDENDTEDFMTTEVLKSFVIP